MLRSTSHAEFKHPASYDRRRMRGSRTMGRSSSQRVLGNNITYGRPNVYPHVEPVTHSMLVEEAPLPRARRSTGRTPRDPITGVPMVSPQEYFAQTQVLPPPCRDPPPHPPLRHVYTTYPRRHQQPQPPPATQQSYRQAGRPIPYRSYYRSRNPSATRLAAADLGYGRFKTKTGE